MINKGFDHFEYSVNIQFIRNIYAMYQVSFRYNPNTANPYSFFRKPNPNSSNYKKRIYLVSYKLGFGQIILMCHNMPYLTIMTYFVML